jgi:hypothetical protein
MGLPLPHQANASSVAVRDEGQGRISGEKQEHEWPAALKVIVQPSS